MQQIRQAAREAALELIEKAKLLPAQTVVVGCSTSEISGKHPGTQSNPEIGKAVFTELYSVFSEKGIHMAAQCCEHLNRAIIIEKEASAGHEIVNVIPAPNAGGAFAAAAYAHFRNPVALEEFQADAGMDIGDTLIGMHLKKVAVPLRLNIKYIGEARLTSARTRPKLIGGTRAVYDETIS